MGTSLSSVRYTRSPQLIVTMKMGIILLVTLACVAVQAQPTGSPPPPTTGDGSSPPPPTGSPPPPTTGDGASHHHQQEVLPHQQQVMVGCSGNMLTKESISNGRTTTNRKSSPNQLQVVHSGWHEVWCR